MLNFDVSSVTDMSSMFQECTSLINLNIYNWNTIKIITMKEMFKSCSSLEFLNLSSFITFTCVEFENFLDDCNENLNIVVDSRKAPNIIEQLPEGINIIYIDLINYFFE